jgi:F-type H+-transporting ATPase subunit b
MFEDPTFWVAVAFVIFFAIIFWLKVHKALFAGLDKRIARIKNELDEAQSLREEAQKTLAEYKRKQRDALAEAEKIVEHAKEEAARLRKAAEKDLEQSLARRAQQAEEKIQQAEAAAVKEVRDRAVDLAIAATGRLLAEHVDEKRAEALIQDSISELSSKLN